ncbi:MAG: LON peptidase substrate-binding domain-containing protein [Planctomycetota bacterium]
MADTVTVDFSKPVPLFPLQQVVVLPHAAAPLHIFEDRYRAMLHRVLDSAGLIAMATFSGEDWKEDYNGNPELRPHVCLGYVARHERLDDGRYNLILQGLARARIREELEVHDDGYRLALLEPTEPRTDEPVDDQPLRQQLEELLADEQLRSLAAVNSVDDWLTDEIPTTAAVDLTAAVFCRDNEQRYALLAEPDPIKRTRFIIQLLRQTRETLVRAKNQGLPTDDDGHPLN